MYVLKLSLKLRTPTVSFRC